MCPACVARLAYDVAASLSRKTMKTEFQDWPDNEETNPGSKARARGKAGTIRQEQRVQFERKSGNDMFFLFLGQLSIFWMRPDDFESVPIYCLGAVEFGGFRDFQN